MLERGHQFHRAPFAHRPTTPDQPWSLRGSVCRSPRTEPAQSRL